MATSVVVHGPLFDGEASAAVTQWLQVTREDLGDKGADMLRAFPMDKTGRAHGGFQANIRVMNRGAMVVIPGPKISGVTWSPWLEGTSRRNDSTGFKGYHLFRKTSAKLRRIAKALAQQKLGEGYIQRMGGHP